MTRALAWSGLTCAGIIVAGAASASLGDVTLPNSPAAYRLQNASIVDPRTARCGRCDPPPPFNRGFWLNNPRGTGVDDPWRPPKVWPQTRYPVVPAYARPSFGFYETKWRVLSVCGTSPWTRTPPAPTPQAAPPATARPATGAGPQAPTTPGTPAGTAPPRATPPTATPPKATAPPTNEAVPAPAVPPANVPKAGELDSPNAAPARSAMANPDEFSPATPASPAPDTPSGITVRAF